MKITREKYEKALKSLPKLRQAEEIIKEWEQAEKDNPETFARSEVMAIERDVFASKEFTLTVQKKLVET